MLEVALWGFAIIGALFLVVAGFRAAGRFGDWCGDVQVAIERAKRLEDLSWKLIRYDDPVWKDLQAKHFAEQLRSKR